jgi:serine/threonine protein kinase
MADVNSRPFYGMPTGLAPGTMVAGYRVEEQIGAGGMAVVYRARDERLGRPVALKVLAPSLASDPEFRVRFIREWRAATAVEHPHIIPVYAADEVDGILYIAMRLVHGGDLSSLVRRTGPLAPQEAVGFVVAVASALDAAHEIGLVHRDIKPGNMLLDSASGLFGHVYLSDFGLTKNAESGTALTTTGSFMGTPDYVAPEQISGARVDGRTDQYALACVAVYLLTGRPPFSRSETVALLWAHMNDAPPSLSALRPDLSPAVDPVIARAMAKSPDQRYASCGQFAAALRQSLHAGSGSHSIPGSGGPHGTIFAPPATQPPAMPSRAATAPPVSLPSPPHRAELVRDSATFRMADPAGMASRPGMPAPVPPRPPAYEPPPFEPLKRTAVGLEPARHTLESNKDRMSGIPLRPILIGAGVVVILLLLWLFQG